MRTKSLFLVLAASLASIAWSPKTEIAVARRGALLGPPDLARQIRKHSAEFSEGVNLPVRTEKAAAFRAELAEKRSKELADGIIRKLNDRTPFPEIVRDLGQLSHWILVAGDPLASSRDPRIASYAADYAIYSERIYEELPRVYYGIRPASLRGDGLIDLLRDARGRAARLSPFVGEEYYRGGSLRRSESFDDLAVTYGVASIALSHSASDVASAFTAIWRRANGDVRPIQLAASEPGWRLAPRPLVSPVIREHRR